MLGTLSSRSQYFCNSIKHLIPQPYIPPFHIRYQNLELKKLTQRCFLKKNGEQMYQYLVIGRDKSYFVKSHLKSNIYFFNFLSDPPRYIHRNSNLQCDIITSFLRLLHKLIEIRHRSKHGIHLCIILDIITKITHRRLVKWTNPDSPHSKVGQVL